MTIIHCPGTNNDNLAKFHFPNQQTTELMRILIVDLQVLCSCQVTVYLLAQCVQQISHVYFLLTPRNLDP